MQQDNEIEKPKRKRETRDPFARRRIPKPDGGYSISVPAGYYTSEEAQKKLRMNRRTFFNHVKDGSIPHEKIPMMSHNMYPKAEIDALADMHIVYMLTKQMLEEEPSAFRIAGLDDIPGISNVLLKLWGESATPSDSLRASWYKVNPQIDYVVTQHGIIVGFFGATPYSYPALEDRMSGKRGSTAMLASEILPFESGQTYDLFVGAVMRPDVPHQERYAARLILGFFHELARLIKRGIHIRYLYACSDQPDGVRLCEKLEFEKQALIPGDKYDRFILDVRASNSLLARRLREEVAMGEPNTPLAVPSPQPVRIAGEQLVEVTRLLRDGSDLLTQSEQAIERLGVGAYPLRRAIQAWQVQVLPYVAPMARGVEEK